MVSDPIGDFIVRLANGGAAKKESVSVPFSNFKFAIAEKLKDAGYIAMVEKRGKKVKKTLEITLKYRVDGRHAIEGVKRVSKPGRRLYAAVHEIHPVRYNHGILIISTPAGVMTGKEAYKAKVGGETLFEIW